ncbi:hypothetical protein EV667_1008 [Ancylobacter aquaticus]|uniref:Uncharacterized protein n=1 Tax=Ancylobacter aquaticus TaxID=100 RepID=A0A4R1I6A6_ANCAQ|nr:hypothetical protein EV667_1008 [Ancylobacter aquaticus]
MQKYADPEYADPGSDSFILPDTARHEEVP